MRGDRLAETALGQEPETEEESALEKWPDLPDNRPRRMLTSKQLKRLSASQQKRLVELSQLMDVEGGVRVAEGLALLAEIPLEYQLVLPHVVDWHATLLRRDGRPKEAFDLLLRQLLALCDEALWLRRGGALVGWVDEILEALSEAEAKAWLQATITALAEICEEATLAAPRLLLADLLSRQREVKLSRLMELLQEALEHPCWRKYHAQLDDWGALLLQGGMIWLEWAEPQGTSELERVGHALLQIPWERSQQCWRGEVLDRLCQGLARAGLWQCVKELASRAPRKTARWAVRAFWLGASAAAQGDQAAALALYREALSLPPTLVDARWLEMARFCLRHGELEEVGLCLSRVQEREEEAFFQVGVAFCLDSGEWEQAELLLEQAVATCGPAPLWRVFEIAYRSASGALEEAEECALSYISDEQQPWRAWVQLLWAELCAQTEREGQAVALFRRHWKALREEPLHPSCTTSRLSRLLLKMGLCFQRLEHDDEALACYLDGLRTTPSERLFSQALGLLLKHGQFEDVTALLEQGLLLFPASQPLRYVQFLMAERAGRWEEGAKALEQIGRGWFEARGMLGEWLLSAMLAKVSRGDLFGAFEICEGDLTWVLKHPELRRLREEIVAQLRERFVELQTALKEQKQSEAALLQLRKTLQRALARQRDLLASKDDARSPSELDAEELWQTAWSGSPEDLSQLLPESRHWLKSALSLRETLSPHPEQDYGPVVLQLSRAVEAEVNRCLLDPLAAYASKVGASWGSFPQGSVCELGPPPNRLSLGDAARMLYHQFEQIEEDGSVSVSRNPHSSAVHAELLDGFWNDLSRRIREPALVDAMRQELPRALLALARLRNRAGHAREMSTRRDAERAQKLVFGCPDERGILSYLLPLTEARSPHDHG